jgi:putative membrane protein
MELARLLFGTIVYRPYVYIFFLCFLFFSFRFLRGRKTLIFILVSYLIAYFSEFSATRNGFPFGMYVYLDETRTRELWISNVPFWDSLSFVFLSYFSWIVAAAVKNPKDPSRALFQWPTAFLGGFLMMLLDLVIDPLALRGDRWFLGRIYYYPNGGAYFGVTLANFAGWFFVGTVTLLVVQRLFRRSEISDTLWPSGTLAVYAGVFFFNLIITAWIGEWPLFMASSLITSVTLASIALRMQKAGILGNFHLKF